MQAFRRGQEITGLLAAAAMATVTSACTTRPPVPPNPPPALDAAVGKQIQPLGPHELVGSIHMGVTADEDESTKTQVKLELNRCYAFSAAADDNTVDEVKIYLFNPNGKRVMDKGSETPQVLASFCVTGQSVVSNIAFGFGGSAMAIPGLYEVELKTTEGHGHVALGVFVSSSDDTASAPPATQDEAAPTAPPED